MKIIIVDDHGKEWTTWTQGKRPLEWLDSDGDPAVAQMATALAKLAQATRDDRFYPS